MSTASPTRRKPSTLLPTWYRKQTHQKKRIACAGGTVEAFFIRCAEARQWRKVPKSPFIVSGSNGDLYTTSDGGRR